MEKKIRLTPKQKEFMAMLNEGKDYASPRMRGVESFGWERTVCALSDKGLIHGATNGNHRDVYFLIDDDMKWHHNGKGEY